MSSYQEILHQAQSLSRDKQEHLLQDLARLVEQRATMPEQNESETSPPLNLKRWQGFLPKQVDALEFQVQIRQEWDD
ncbi:hypothetical protein PN466_23065 [Roseofilum reptotaenium CS-1145]|uniref:DUF2281 domain-containing protein n=1 Tax=Roseofilum reptotaenium AO1-A TaxID=1925591 RepID=A0A1L9QJQ3_9CYAN|nr:hypothetical protein [Roseofilum reptotaenium]MDB9519828.1 hypothetical protein [Roseofilum reptotaenium CS-1145]OJJ15002.1 hypothetical protein BI308_24650 [Roseofilum reptotaenium AO1-A]